MVLATLARLLWARLAPALEAAPPGALRVTGLLGLAAVIYLACSWGDRPTPPGDGGGGPGRTAPPLRLRPGTATGVGPPIGAGAGGAAPMTPVSAALRARLGGARVVTVSAPGLLLEEWEPEELESGATLRPGAAAALRSLAAAVPGGVYLVARVSGDVGEAAVRAALEAGGVVGGGGRGRAGGGGGPPPAASTSTSTSPRPHPPIPPQRLLFCETVTGKVALARQLEAGLHIDGCGATIDELARFVPRLIYVDRGDGGGGGGGGGEVAGGVATPAPAPPPPAAVGVVRAASLAGALGL